MDENDRIQVAAEVGKLGINVDPNDIPEIDPGMLEQGIIEIMNSRAEKHECSVNAMAIYCTLVPETRVLKSKKKYRPMLHTIYVKDNKPFKTEKEPVRKYSSLDQYFGLISRMFREILLGAFNLPQYAVHELKIEEICIQFTIVGQGDHQQLKADVKSKINQGVILESIDLKEIFK